MARVPLAWLIVALIIGVFAFFGYHIMQASKTTTKDGMTNSPMRVHFADNPVTGIEQQPQQQYESETGTDYTHAPVVHTHPPIPQSMPHVPGQTEDDLRAPEPFQATPPRVDYDTPEATHPLNKTVYMNSEFGSNLRHPEQMMEPHPQRGMNSVVPSGLGSEASSPGGNDASGYNPEMLQNSGEFMKGIHAFDGSDNGVGYSML